jgi:hypothetical protein
MHIVSQSWNTGNTKYKERNEPRDWDPDEAGNRVAIAAAEIETVTDYAALFIKTTEMQPALALYCGVMKRR